MQNPESLLARVHKESIIKIGLMETRKGAIPSYSWRTILAGKELLKNGLPVLINEPSR